jgi:hypothetical protein
MNIRKQAKAAYVVSDDNGIFNVCLNQANAIELLLSVSGNQENKDMASRIKEDLKTSSTIQLLAGYKIQIFFTKI